MRSEPGTRAEMLPLVQTTRPPRGSSACRSQTIWRIRPSTPADGRLMTPSSPAAAPAPPPAPPALASPWLALTFCGLISARVRGGGPGLAAGQVRTLRRALNAVAASAAAGGGTGRRLRMLLLL